MAEFHVVINGQPITVDAADPIEAHQKAQAEAAKGPVTRGVESVGTGLRQAGEGTLGTAGSGGSMLGGAARWAATQADKVLPESMQIDPQHAGEQVAGITDPIIKQLTPATGIANVAEALRRLGIIGPEAAATTSATVAPTIQQAHSGASTAMDKVGASGLDDATSQVPQGHLDETLQLLGNFLTLGAGKGGTLATTAKVATPTLAVEGGDLVTDEMVKSGTITPETQIAIKTLLGMAGAGVGNAGGSAMEAGLVQRQAAQTIGSNRAAVRALYDGLLRDYKTPEAAKQAMADLGIDATLMDVGPNLEQLGIKAATSPGEGQAAVKRVLNEREAQTGTRLKDDKVTALGPEVNRDTVMADNKAARKSLGDHYPAAKANQARPGDLQPIADALDGELATARGAMREPLQRVRDALDVPGKKGQLDPTASGMHAMREALDQEIAKAEKGSPLWGKLNDYRKQLDTELKAAAPDIKALDEQVSSLHKEREAFETGEKALKKGGQPGEVKSPSEFDVIWSKMTEPERRQAASGASRFIDETIGSTDRERSRLKTVLGGDWNEGKLRTMIGDERTDAFLSALAREDTFKATQQRIVHGSRTLEGLEDGKQSLTEGVGEAAFGGGAGAGYKGAAVAAGAKLGRNFLTRMLATKGKTEALKSDIGELLARGRDDDVFAALEKFQREKGQILPAKVIAALLQRQNELGNRQ